MALREFRDRNGTEWKVWDIRTETMHPVTAREMFIGRYVDFQEGWLVFESERERRRLAPFPTMWAEFPDDQLEALLAMAQPSPSRLGRESSGAFPRVIEKHALAENLETTEGSPAAAAAATTAAGRPDPAPTTPSRRESAREGDRREFVGPSGRRWTVALAETRRRDAVSGAGDTGSGGAATGTRRVLRFSANDGTVCDLDAWPDDWPRYTTAQLMELLRHAEPARDVAVVADQPPRRRREDRQP